MRGAVTAIVPALVLLACSAPPFEHSDVGRAWPAAEAIFRRDPRWLGADAALTIPLDAARTLWLFGDTFVARTAAHTRTESEMVRNTIAVQSGLDMRSASMTFHWRQDADGSPAAFFGERGERWFWPGHGIRLAEGPLLVFLFELIGTPGQGLGFASSGWALAVVDDPDASPATWRPRIVPASASPFDAVPATAVLRDGAWIVALAIRQQGAHAGALVRWPALALARGELGGAQWWAATGWVAEAELGARGPTFVLDDAGAECSLHRDARIGGFVHVASYGFGVSTIGVRTARELTGPWSAPRTVYRPPESDGPRPFVYAAKAHPELIPPRQGELVVTYATNSFAFGDLFTPAGTQSLYWPRCVLVR